LKLIASRLFLSQNPLDSIPYFRFRYANVDKSSTVYTKLIEQVDSFEGKVQWTIVTKDGSANYMLIPKKFVPLLDNYSEIVLKNFTIENNSFDHFMEMICSDIPCLCQQIRKAFDN